MSYVSPCQRASTPATLLIRHTPDTESLTCTPSGLRPGQARPVAGSGLFLMSFAVLWPLGTGMAHTDKKTRKADSLFKIQTALAVVKAQTRFNVRSSSR